MTALLFPCLERPGWGHWSMLATSGHASLPSPPRDPGHPELWVPGHLWGGLTISAPTWAQGTPQPPQMTQLESLACSRHPLPPNALPGHGSPLLTATAATPALVPGHPCSGPPVTVWTTQEQDRMLALEHVCGALPGVPTRLGQAGGASATPSLSSLRPVQPGRASGTQSGTVCPGLGQGWESWAQGRAHSWHARLLGGVGI